MEEAAETLCALRSKRCRLGRCSIADDRCDRALIVTHSQRNGEQCMIAQLEQAQPSETVNRVCSMRDRIIAAVSRRDLRAVAVEAHLDVRGNLTTLECSSARNGRRLDE